MKKIVFCCFAFICVVVACGDKQGKQKSGTVDIKKEKTTEKVEVVDSTEIKKRQEELQKEDSLRRIEEEKLTKAKQECATKVLFLEEFYTNFFNSPEKTVEQYASNRLLSELRSEATQYEGNALPVWKFASGSGATCTWKVNIPDDPKSNVFTVDISEAGKSYKVYLTVTGYGGVYYIENVKNSLGN